MKGKNHRGRPRLENIQQLIRDHLCDLWVQMKSKAIDREEWKVAVQDSIIQLYGV